LPSSRQFSFRSPTSRMTITGHLLSQHSSLGLLVQLLFSFSPSKSILKTLVWDPMLTFTFSINIFRTTPSRYAGTVGAVFNAALQLGSAIGTSATTSIQASVDARSAGEDAGFKGRSAALWFLVAWVGLEIIGVAVFFKRSAESPQDEESSVDKKGTRIVVH
jgi:hypothetical protein